MTSSKGCTRYKITIEKQTVIDLDSDLEAAQIAEFMADRESRNRSFAGLISTVSSKYELA